MSEHTSSLEQPAPESPDGTTSSAMLAAVVAVLVVVVAGWRFGRTTADPDLWGHVLNGLDMVEAGRYVGVDQYSYLSGEQAWINHHWLANVVMGFTYDQFGSAGLVSLKALVALGVVGFMTWWLIRRGLAPVRAAVVGVLLVAVLTPTLATFRPQVFTVACALVLMVVMVEVESGRSLWLWTLPPLFLLWANLHGGFLAGLGILGTWAAIHAFRTRGRSRFWPLLAFGGSVLAAMINPEGWHRLWFLIETATVSRPEIQDWQPIELASAVGGIYLVLVGIVVVALIVERRRLNPALVFPLVVLLIAPLLAWRHLQLFALAVGILGATYIAGLSSRLGPATADREPTSDGSRLVSVALVVAVAVGSIGFGMFAPCIRVVASQFEVPQRAVGTWASSDPAGNAVVPFNWGEYVRWQLGPAVQVSMDGRRETVYTEEVSQANLEFMRGGPAWDRLLELGPAEWILAPAASPVVELVDSTGEWELVYEDSLAVLFAPGPVALEELDLPVDGNGSCFPAGF